jgi:uncharacterized protein YecT (DUF1311 family)
MKKYFIIASLLIGINLLASDCSNAETTEQRNDCIYSEYEQADKKLNATYNQVMKKLNPDMKANLKKSQKAWLQFVDTEREFEESVQCLGGNCSASVSYGSLVTKTQRVQIREEELRQHLNDL